MATEEKKDYSGFGELQKIEIEELNEEMAVYALSATCVAMIS